MEGAMNRMHNEHDEIDYDAEPDSTAKNTADVTGLCFAVAVLCAFLTASVIVYRTGDPPMITAANTSPPVMTKAGPFDPAPILPQH
jgi:hypothetical protein